MVAKYSMSEAVARLSSTAGGFRLVIVAERIMSAIVGQPSFCAPSYVIEMVKLLMRWPC